MIFKNKKILLISPEPWGINYVSKHHYAIELSGSNKVFFLNPPAMEFSKIRINENLKIIHYRTLFRGINRLPRKIRNFFNSLMIRRIMKTCEISHFDIIWSFDPFRFQNLALFSSQLMIYHPVDLHNTPFEEEISKSADLILTTCNEIKNRLAMYNSSVFNIGHGVAERFTIIKTKSTKKPDRIKVCMMGNLQRGIDYPILFKLIKKNNDVEFHFIGPFESSNLSQNLKFSVEIDKLRSFPNTYLHGSIAQSKLPELLTKMDLFLIIYREDENPASRANPHKLLEYLSTGRPIISTWVEEYKNKSELIEMVKYNSELPAKFEYVLNNLAEFNSENSVFNRIQYALENTYIKKIKFIEILVKNNSKNKVR